MAAVRQHCVLSWGALLISTTRLQHCNVYTSTMLLCDCKRPESRCFPSQFPPAAAPLSCPTRQPHAPNSFSSDCGPSSPIRSPSSLAHVAIATPLQRQHLPGAATDILNVPLCPFIQNKTICQIYFLFSAITNSLVPYYHLKTNVRTIETHLIPIYCRHFTMHFKLFRPYSHDTSCTFTAKACKRVSSLVNEHEALVQSPDHMCGT